MTSDEILTALDSIRRRGDVDQQTATIIHESIALIRQLQTELASTYRITYVEQQTETIHDRDARAAMQTYISIVARAPAEDLESSYEAIPRAALDMADRMAAERARRAKEGK